MSQKVNMNVFLHSLLVSKQMNNFTVTEAKDVLIKEHAEFHDTTEARKFIYRQLTRNISKGLIKRTDSTVKGIKKVTYSKTELFFKSNIAPVKRETKKTLKPRSIQKTCPPENYHVELKKELVAAEIDLDTLLEEAKEYKRLSTRFPELHKQLQHHQSQTKEKSIKVLGKIHALQNLLGYETTGRSLC